MTVPTETAPKSRIQYINDPAFQLRYAFALVGIGTGCFVFMSFLLYFAVRRVGEESVGALMSDLSAAQLFLRLDVLVPSAVILVFLFCLGIIGTNSFAGPLFAIKRHFDGMQTGRRKGPIQLRAGDELQDLAESVNSYIGFVDERDLEIERTVRQAQRCLDSDRPDEVAAAKRRLEEILILMARSGS